MNLDKNKLKIMILTELKNQTLDHDCFKQLCGAYLTVQNIPIYNPLPPPPPPVHITLEKPQFIGVQNNYFLVKDANMSDVIKELESNKMFLKRRLLVDANEMEEII